MTQAGILFNLPAIPYKWRRAARNWIPRAIFDLIRQFRNRDAIRIKGPFASWDEAKSLSTGYDHEIILERVRAATLAVKAGSAAYERDSVLFDDTEYAWPVIAGLMLSAARNGGRLRVLDYGGSLGSSYFQNRKFLGMLNDMNWGVVEQPHFVKCGQHEIEDDRLRFFSSIEQCVRKLKPNTGLLSGVLHVVESPYDVLDAISSTDIHTLIIDRTPFIDGTGDLACVQYVPEQIYPADYPVWLLSESKFAARIQGEWDLIETFTALDDLPAPVETTWKGMILVRETASR